MAFPASVRKVMTVLSSLRRSANLWVGKQGPSAVVCDCPLCEGGSVPPSVPTMQLMTGVQARGALQVALGVLACT